MQSKWICAFIIFGGLIGGTYVAAEEASSLRLEEAPPSGKNKVSAEWKGKMGGGALSEGKNEGAAALLDIQTRFVYPLAPWARIQVEPEARLASSRVQERFDDNDYQNYLRLDAGYLELNPFSHVVLRAGAISQEDMRFEILISKHRTFPGLQETFSADTQPFNFQLIAQQLVPASYTLNTEREDKEPLPIFQTQELKVDGRFRAATILTSVGHYTWERLPDKVAYESFLAGNVPDNGEAVPGSKFSYGFDGFFWRGGFCFCDLRPLKIDFMYWGEHNTKAQSNRANGQMWMIRPTWVMGKRELSVGYFSYFLESEATVALYTRPLFGHANRIGDMIEVKYDLKDLGWSLIGQYSNARTLIDNPNQQTYSELNLWVETSYASF